MKMKLYDRITCSTGCAQSLREDRRLGLIYGPYGTRLPDGSVRLYSMEEFAARSDECIYCTGPLPRGRAKRLLQHIEEHRA